jgi:opacity protein-like surface antigen
MGTDVPTEIGGMKENPMKLRMFVPLVGAMFFLGQAVSAQSYSVEIYGGGTFDRPEDFDGDAFDMDRGSAFGAGLYTSSLVSGVELGVDLLHTEASYVDFVIDVETLSVMAVARLPFALSRNTTGYVGAGLGAIDVRYSHPNFSDSDIVAGGQLSLGARYQISDRTGIFGEIRYQAAFDEADIVNPGIGANRQSYASTSALVGVKIGF